MKLRVCVVTLFLLLAAFPSLPHSAPLQLRVRFRPLLYRPFHDPLSGHPGYRVRSLHLHGRLVR